MTAYYRLRFSRITAADYRAWNPNFSSLVFWTFRLRALLDNLPGAYVPDPSLLELIEPHQIDHPGVAAALDTLVSQAQLEGLEVVYWDRMPMLFPGMTVSAVLLSRCRRFTAVASATTGAE